jgi:cytochrome b561
MKKIQQTSLPAHTTVSQKIAAKIVHLGMYGGLGVIALTGLIIGLLFRFRF